MVAEKQVTHMAMEANIILSMAPLEKMVGSALLRTLELSSLSHSPIDLALYLIKNKRIKTHSDESKGEWGRQL